MINIPANLRIGKSNYGGQDPDEGITFATVGTVDVGDTVQHSATLDGSVERAAVDAEPIGVLVTKERDGRGAVYNFENVTVCKLTGAFRRGVAKITADGAGGVKLLDPAGTVGLKVVVIGQQVIGTDTFVALYRQ